MEKDGEGQKKIEKDSVRKDTEVWRRMEKNEKGWKRM